MQTILSGFPGGKGGLAPPSNIGGGGGTNSGNSSPPGGAPAGCACGCRMVAYIGKDFVGPVGSGTITTCGCEGSPNVV